MILNSSMSEPGAPKVNKASKKNKKSWRKNVDMQQVNQFLDEQRFEERVGGSFADRPDEKLFSIETEAKEEIETKKNRKEIKPLRCFANLKGLPGAKDPKPLRNYTLPPEERENPIVKAMKLQKIKSGKVQKKFKDKKADREAHLKLKEAGKAEAATRRRTEFDFDLWDNETPVGGPKAAMKDKDRVKAEGIKDWVRPEGLVHNAIGQANYVPKYSKARNFSTGTSVPAVEVPDPGASYNPNLDDHQNLLWKAAIVEIQKEKDLQKIERATTAMFPAKKDAPTEKSYMQEMSEGIAELTGEKEEENNEIGEDEEVNTEVEENEEESKETCEDEGKEKLVENDNEDDKSKTILKPKTRKQKRDKRKRMFEDQQKERDKDTKLREIEITRLKSIRKELKAEDQITTENMEKRAKAAEEKMAAPLKLSNNKFEPQEIEIKLSDELTGNLRNLRPEGSLLEDRFKSLQKRNLIEVRVKAKTVKRLKRKTFEKRDHKMGWEENKNVTAKKIRAEKKARARGKKTKSSL